jgi:hypothetical protein
MPTLAPHNCRQKSVVPSAEGQPPPSMMGDPVLIRTASGSFRGGTKATPKDWS